MDEDQEVVVAEVLGDSFFVDLPAIQVNIGASQRDESHPQSADKKTLVPVEKKGRDNDLEAETDEQEEHQRGLFFGHEIGQVVDEKRKNHDTDEGTEVNGKVFDCRTVHGEVGNSSADEEFTDEEDDDVQDHEVTPAIFEEDAGDEDDEDGQKDEEEEGEGADVIEVDERGEVFALVVEGGHEGEEQYARGQEVQLEKGHSEKEVRLSLHGKKVDLLLYIQFDVGHLQIHLKNFASLRSNYTIVLILMHFVL